MVHFSEKILDNGLTVIANEDRSTPLAAVSLLYKVGSKHENPERTGFAHLFEHLMFGGSQNAPNFDGPLQHAGGENNAYTTNDYTLFYEVLPAENIETALWLESDRMAYLKISPNALGVQRKVVVEEFKETCCEEPYGDFWHKASALAYPGHPYFWPVIGLSFEHIEEANLADVRSFYKKWYQPQNAILCISGNIEETRVFELAEKWFGSIQNRTQLPTFVAPKEQASIQTAVSLESDVPLPAVYLIFKMAERASEDFYAADFLSDILSAGPSSRLYQNLLKRDKLFSAIEAYVTATFEHGLFIIEGKPAEGVSLEIAKEAIWKELETLKNQPIGERELQKHKNRYESSLLFSEMSVMSKAQNLCQYCALGNTHLINEEPLKYNALTPSDLQKSAKNLFNKGNSIELLYVPKRH